ncbi:MAG TPA: hypothetical protein VGQ68_08125 [Gaiellaceae bacterium]|nr:hypothetical protein [Gaiellaceae bacterium]
MRRLRKTAVPEVFGNSDAPVLVTGETAESLDYFALVHRWLPIVFAFVLSLSFVLLTISFRSIVGPLKAIVLNLLSVGAAHPHRPAAGEHEAAWRCELVPTVVAALAA